MRIRAGCDLAYECPQPTATLLALSVHPSRRADLMTGQVLRFTPAVEARDYLDGFGNICTRIVAPEGRLAIATLFDIHDTGRPDASAPDARQHDIRELPDEALVFLLGSRYCETDRLGEFAWARFGGTPAGWPRVQAITDFVHDHLTFGYPDADPLRTAWSAFQERVGVCRDFAHLAITLCRCMNVPARYCTGYLGDIGVPPLPDPMDFSAWFEVYLGEGWHTLDARHNEPRIGRVLMGRGRDAVDVALTTSFGNTTLTKFTVWTHAV
jgi:transglutaminase-like putative cysteine protease